MRYRAGVAVVAVGALLLALTTNVAADLVPPPMRQAWIVWTMFAALAVITVSAAVRDARQPDEPSLSATADKLANAVRAQWRAEAAMRSLTSPQPIRIRWSITHRPLGASLNDVTAGCVGGNVRTLRVAGDIRTIQEKFSQLPRRQLCIIGAPGAGKTVLAMSLTLDLLDAREEGGPVPVLISLSSWSPDREHLFSWLARRIAEDYPALRAVGSDRKNAALRLVEQRMILPILDGLDEMATPLPVAISELGRALGNDHAAVITSRTAPLEEAIPLATENLSASLFIEIEDMQVSDLLAYLGYPEHGDGWAPLVNALRVNETSVLATALSTPLMAWLLRTAYGWSGVRVDGSEVAELLDDTRFPERSAIENHLLDSLVPAVYRAAATAPAIEPRRPAYAADDAERWLTTLAALHTRRPPHGGHSGTTVMTDIAWWRLHETLRRWQLGVMAFVAGGALVTIPAVSIVGLTVGFGDHRGALVAAGLLIGLTGATVVAVFFRPPPPGRVEIRVPRIGDLLNIHARLSYAAMAGVTFGTAIVVGGVASGRPLQGVVGYGFRYGLIGALAVMGVALLNGPVDTVRVVSAEAVLAADRRVATATALLTVLAVVVVIVPRAGFGLGVGAGVSSGLAIGVGMSAWGWYQIARGWLTLRRNLPPQLMRFLNDAYERGVLRRAGSVFQFRHARLQERLQQRSR